MKNKENYERSEKVRVSHKEKIFRVFEENKSKWFTSQDIKEILNFKELVQVTKRISELEAEGVISECGTIEINNRIFTKYTWTPLTLIEMYKKKVWTSRYYDYLNQGKKHGYLTEKQVIEILYNYEQ